jgi:hypothetical protein
MDRDDSKILILQKHGNPALVWILVDGGMSNVVVRAAREKPFPKGTSPRGNLAS